MEHIEISATKNNEQRNAQHTEPISKCAAHEASIGSNGGTTSGNSNHKLGSRRIFTPQFKLQVLESYRSDNDCKGNQRATARKYNIHRRQIQKWLQCESSLRSSVANINQNTVKHQFHNISIHQQTAPKISIQNSAVMGVSYGTTNQNSHSETNLSCVRMPTGANVSPSQTQAVFSAASLAAVVAAAAGAMTITTAPSNGSSVPSESISSPLRSSSIVGINSNTTTTMSPLLHHHHYGVHSYIHAPASVQLSVPILTHHTTHPQHIHPQTQQHQPYQYHNLAYTQTLLHPSDKQQSSFLSSLSLTEINALSAAASSPTSSANGFTIVGEVEKSDAMEQLLFGAKTGSESVLKTSRLEQSCQPKTVYQGGEYRGVSHPKPIHSAMYQFKGDVYPIMYPLGPMDLSVRHRRDECLEHLSYSRKNSEIKIQDIASANVVDLTHRKRKGSNSTCYAIADYQSELYEKHPKLQIPTSRSKSKLETHANFEEEEVEVEVVTEEKLPTSKPIKLFKPYLLDEEADTDNSVTCSSRSTETRFGESGEFNCPWISCATNPSPSDCYDIIPCQGAAFQYSVNDSFSSPREGSNFQSETKSAFTSIPATSPTSFRCPKGSPSSSGYESSSSTYSDSSLSSQAESCPFARTYSINLQVHPIFNDNVKLHSSKHVERWLEQEA